MTRIRTNAGNSKLWVNIDKATDVTGRQIANMIVGTREEREQSKIYMFNAQQLYKTNSTIMAQLFATSLARWHTF